MIDLNRNTQNLWYADGENIIGTPQIGAFKLIEQKGIFDTILVYSLFLLPSFIRREGENNNQSCTKKNNVFLIGAIKLIISNVFSIVKISIQKIKQRYYWYVGKAKTKSQGAIEKVKYCNCNIIKFTNW